LAWIPSTLASASSSVGHGASVFTGDLLAWQLHNCGLAGSLRHVRGFPTLGLLRTLRPTPEPSADGEPARLRAGSTQGRGAPGWFPCSPCSGRQDGRPAMPLRLCHDYAAGFRRGLRRRDHNPTPKSAPHAKWEPRTAAQPISTRLELVPRLSGFNHWFTLVTPFCLACRAPGHLAVLARPVVVRAASHPPERLFGQAALSFTGLLRQPGAAGLSPATGNRAPHGAR